MKLIRDSLTDSAPASSAVKLIAEGSPSCCSKESISTVSRPTCKEEMHTHPLRQSISLRDYALSAYPCYTFFIDLVVSKYRSHQFKPCCDELFKIMRKQSLVSDECAKLAAQSSKRHQNSSELTKIPKWDFVGKIDRNLLLAIELLRTCGIPMRALSTKFLVPRVRRLHW